MVIDCSSSTTTSTATTSDLAADALSELKPLLPPHPSSLQCSVPWIGISRRFCHKIVFWSCFVFRSLWSVETHLIAIPTNYQTITNDYSDMFMTTFRLLVNWYLSRLAEVYFFAKITRFFGLFWLDSIAVSVFVIIGWVGQILSIRSQDPNNSSDT